MTKLFYSENYEAEIPATLESMKRKLGLVQKFYGDKQFALGYLTLPDLEFAELAYYIRTLSQEFYSSFPFLENVRVAVSELPEIKSYYDRNNAVNGPFMPPNCNLKPEI